MDVMPAGRANRFQAADNKEVRTMRRLALLLAGGALWLVFLAMPAFADGGPHVLPNNNGTGTIGLAGDCAACHRAHTAQAADLLKATMPGLCLTCHDGTGASTNVVDGVQYVPVGTQGDHTSTVLGALRGGGFEYALIDPAGATRLTYNSRGGITLTFSAAPSSGSSIDLVWPAIGSFAGGTLTISSPLTASTIQADADTLFGTSTTYTTSTSAQYMSGTATNLMKVSVNGNVVTFTPYNEFRRAAIGLPTTENNSTGTTATVVNGISAGNTSHIVALAANAGQPTTSMHEGTGTVWGNGTAGSASKGATGVSLECTNCHNPHGNGQYRILNTLPGEDWANGVNGVANWTAPTNAVQIFDVGVTTSAKNYTINPGIQASDVVGGVTDGDYWRYKLDPSGQANFTNTYLLADQMNTGWNGLSVTNVAAMGTAQALLGGNITSSATSLTVASATGYPSTVPFYVTVDSELMQVTKVVGTTFTVSRGLGGTTAVAHTTGPSVTVAVNTTTTEWNKTGLMTAWCITCHTRYNGYLVDANGALTNPSGSNAPSLVAQTPLDSTFMFKHGTARIGCEQCHVSHGTNVTMDLESTINFPDGSTEDSALLKVVNRGTCQLCHDPTGTVTAGTTVGTVPSGPNPGP
jgi:predicted CXXCH cytochrome family protein